jgi:hypothetical protein
MSGMRARDVQASLDLVSAATEFAHQVLRPAKQSTEAESAADSGASNGLDAEADGRKQPNKPKRYPGGSLV